MFIQIHLIRASGPANSNRQENGRPKTAVIGDTLRNILSPQNGKYNLKRALAKRFKIVMGEQTPMLGKHVYAKLVDGGVPEKEAENYALNVIGAFVDISKRLKKDEEKDEKKDNKKKKAPKKKERDILKTETIKIQPVEMEYVNELTEKIIDGHKPQKNEYDFLRQNSAIDIALTGRMIARKPQYDVQAALSTNFTFSVNDIDHIQQDYYTATDTLQLDGSKGSGHLDHFYFSQGVYYGLYIIDTDLLVSNLCDNKKLAIKTVKQIVEVLATSSPEANKNRTADSQTWPSFIMIEKSPFSPRSLCSAFQVPVSGPDLTINAIKALEETKSRFDKCYGPMEHLIMNEKSGEGSLKELIDFIEF